MTGPNGQIEIVTGDEAQQALEKVAGVSSVIELGHELGISPTEALRHATVERMPATVENFEQAAGKLFISVTWENGAERAVRTSHFVPFDDSGVDSNIVREPKDGAEPVSFGKLGGSLTVVTDDEAQRASQNLAVSQSFTQCVASCLGISQAFANTVIAGCGLACAISAGTGCIICAAGAFGFSAGTVGGCFVGCS